MWRVQAVTAEGTAFTNRLSLLESWHGLRDANLVAASGVDGAKFCHANGFIGTREAAWAHTARLRPHRRHDAWPPLRMAGGAESYEGARAMALKSIGHE